jgi:zinc transporter ZupT
MMWTLLTAITVAGLAGVLLAPYLARRQGLREHCIAFAAGVLLTVIVAHVVPESIKTNHEMGGALILLGFVAMMFLQQKVLKADPCCGHEHAKHAGLPSYLAMVACSINDGVLLHGDSHAHGAAAAADAATGPSQALLWAMCGHKFTASFALWMLLGETSAGLRTSMRYAYMLLFVLITPAVIVLSHQLHFLESWMPHIVAAGAGALLYVVCGGLIPRVEHIAQERRGGVLMTFLVAAGITIAVELIAPHHHQH